MINVIDVTHYIIRSDNLKLKKYIFEINFPKLVDFGPGLVIRKCHWKKVIKFLLKSRVHVEETHKCMKIYFDNIGDIIRFINQYNEIYIGFITQSKLKIDKDKDTWK